jgi:8-oxo-dGTP diphosphatase
MDLIRHTLRCAVYALIIKEDKILLLLRQNTRWMDGMYSLPAGHLEKGETIIQALQREVYEEAGIKINGNDAEFIQVMHRNEKDNFEYIDFFFVVKKWSGSVKNNELEKAVHIKWFDLDALPENIIPNVKAGMLNYQKQIVFSELN